MRFVGMNLYPYNWSVVKPERPILFQTKLEIINSLIIKSYLILVIILNKNFNGTLMLQFMILGTTNSFPSCNKNDWMITMSVGILDQDQITIDERN